VVVKTGNGKSTLAELKRLGVNDFVVFENLAEAADSIISGIK
jgi:hypothetical protein